MPTKRELELEIARLKKRLQEKERLVQAAMRKMVEMGGAEMALTITQEEIAKTQSKNTY